MSHPMWVRGLKLAKLDEWCVKYNVAPHVGAWIETLHHCKRFFGSLVAPHVGAWIETEAVGQRGITNIVAPHVGAWIETRYRHIPLR